MNIVNTFFDFYEVSHMNVIAHNLPAMNTNRQFNIVTKNKAKSTEKLSSGYRINRASDDAAGLSISEKMRRQIRGLSQGIRNTEEGVSLCQVADGALAEVSDMLHRITELSVQSANDANTDDDRNAIQHEIGRIMQEIERIGDTTEFNERKIFKGVEPPISNVPENIGSAPAIPYMENIQNSFSITGSPFGLMSGTYIVSADAAGISIGSENFVWADFKDSSGNDFDISAIVDGSYSMDFHGLKIAFNTQTGGSEDDVIDAINNASFQITATLQTYTPVRMTGYGLNKGTDTENFLSKPPSYYNYNNGYKIYADDNGIKVQGYDYISWASMGIDDINNAGNKSINFADPKSGVTFQATFDSAATKNDIYQAINRTEFQWRWRGEKPDEHALIGYASTSSTKNYSNWGLRAQSVYSGLYDELGYTTQMEKMDPITLDVSVSGTGDLVSGSAYKRDLQVTISAPNGNTKTLNYYSATRDYLTFGYNDTIQVCLSNSGIDYGISDTLAKSLSTKGNMGTITVPGPIYYKYNMNTTTKTYYNVKSVKVFDNRGQSTPITPPDNPDSDTDTSGLSLWIQSGSEAGQGMYLQIDRMNTSVLGIDNLDVSTAAGANHAISAAGKALEKISSNRSKIGAQQNRLEHTIASEQNTVENTAAAESRIRDTDMAKEMVAFSKEMILENAGQAMLSQANKNNQDVLSLLS
ncbi:MAG: flagellin [Bacteroides sp.]